MSDQTSNIVEALKEISGESGIPKNLREKLNNIIAELNSKEGDLSLKISKVLHQLEEISEDNNLQPYTRTQIWNIVSMLEMVD